MRAVLLMTTVVNCFLPFCYAFAKPPISAAAFPPGRWAVTDTNDRRLSLNPPHIVTVQGNYFLVNKLVQGTFAIYHAEEEIDESEESRVSDYKVVMSLWGLSTFGRKYALHVMDPKTVVLTREDLFYRLIHKS